MKFLAGCPVCCAGAVKLVYAATTTRGHDQRVWQVFQCNSCSHQFMNPQPSWDDLQCYYSSDYDAYDPSHGSRADDKWEIEQAKTTGELRHIPLPIGKKVLDVGCGGGFFLRIAKSLGAVVQGIEPSEFAVHAAQSRGLEVFHGTIEKYASQASERELFDVITANHVLEHVPEPVETLSTMKKFLAPGGHIWIAVPNAAYPIGRAIKGKWHSTDLPYHLMQFTPTSMVEAGRRAGLIVWSQQTESVPAFVMESITQYLRFRWKLPRRLTKKISLLNVAAGWYAKRADARLAGEAILTEFIAA